MLQSQEIKYAGILNLNRLESLFGILNKLLSQKSLKVKILNWDDLGSAFKTVLDEGMNGGIPRKKVVYTVCDVEGSGLCMAEYHDSETNFTAHYLAYEGELVYSNEF